MSGPLRSLAVLPIAVVAAGWVIAAIDYARASELLGSGLDGHRVELVLALLSAYGLTGFAIGVVVAVLTGVVVTFDGRARPRVGALLGAAFGIWLSGRLYSGPSIREHALVWPLRLMTPVVTAVGLACLVMLLGRAVRFARGGLGALACAAACVGVAVAFDRADAWPSLTGYDYVRDLIGIGVIVSVGAAIAIPWSARGGARPLRAFAIAVIVAVPAWVLAPDEFTRFAVGQKTRYGARVTALWRDVLPGGDRPGDVERNAAFGAAREAEFARRPALRQRVRSSVPSTPRNLLWITIDTCRADRLSCYGHRPETTPVVDRIAAEGTRFENASAQYSITHFSFQSMFYGRYPTATPLYRSSRGVEEEGDNVRTLAEHLRAAGFLTGTVPAVGRDRLRAGIYEVMGKGFEIVYPGQLATARRDAPLQARSAIEFLEMVGDRRWHLWLHFMDPHHPYKKHADHDYGDEPQERYLSEIAATDEAIGRVIDHLRTTGVLDDTVIVVNSDHGEAFGEHGTRFHGTTLYEEQLRVPLIVRVPGVAPRVVRTPAENVDIVPTVLDFLDIDHDLALQGSSLVPLILGGDADPDAPAGIQFSELPPAKTGLAATKAVRDALRWDDWKLIWNPQDSVAELYDLANDPGEATNVAGSRPDVVARLRGAIAVLKEESRTLNRSGSGEPVSLAARLSAAPMSEREAILRGAAKADADGVREALLAFFLDPEAPEAAKRNLMIVAETAFGGDVAELAWALTPMTASWSTAARGLDALMRCPGDLRAPEGAADRVAALLGGPTPVAVRAAVVLARVGDPRGRDHLERLHGSADADVAFLASAGLLHLGDARGRAALEEVILPFAGHPARTVVALEAIRARPSATVVPRLWELLLEQFPHPRNRDRALAILKALGKDEDATAAWLPALTLYDPEGSAAARAMVSTIFGAARRSALERAAREASTALDMSGAGEYAGARAAWLRAATGCGSDRAAALPLLQAARLSHILRDDVARDALVGRVIRSGTLAPWVDAARRLSQMPRKRGPLSVTASVPRRADLAPALPGYEGVWEVEVRNTGAEWIPGGLWPLAPRARVRFTGSVNARKGRNLGLPPGGLAPGASTTVRIATSLPAEAGDLKIGIDWRWHRGETIVTEPPRSPDLSAALPGGRAVGSTAAGRIDGAAIRHGWLLGLDEVGGSVTEDGTLEWLNGGRHSWLLSPIFVDTKKPVTVTIKLGVRSRHGATAGLVAEVGWGPDPTASPSTTLKLDLPTDGTLFERKLTLVPQNGSSVRWLRLVPGPDADLIRVAFVELARP